MVTMSRCMACKDGLLLYSNSQLLTIVYGLNCKVILVFSNVLLFPLGFDTQLMCFTRDLCKLLVFTYTDATCPHTLIPTKSSTDVRC